MKSILHQFLLPLSLLVIHAPGAWTQQTLASDPCPVVVQASAAERLIELGQSDNRVMGHLVELTETFGPRLTGSSSLNRAGEWARDRFASFGLEAP